MEDAKKRISDEAITPEEAKERFIYNMSFPSGEHYRHQKKNIELAKDYRVEIDGLRFYWVFRYPMEQEQEWIKNREAYSEGVQYTKTNAYSKDDKYGYFYINPEGPTIMFRPNEWNPEQLAEVGSFDN